MKNIGHFTSAMVLMAWLIAAPSRAAEPIQTSPAATSAAQVGGPPSVQPSSSAGAGATADFSLANRAGDSFKGRIGIANSALAPPPTTPNGSVAKGAVYTADIRSGGYGAYGDWLNLYTVTAATPAPQFDAAVTAWATNENLTGGYVFGSWFAANTPSKYLGETYSGGGAVGQEINSGNRWADLGLVSDPGAAFSTTGQNIVPDVGPAADGVNKTQVTISNASPAVVTLANHNYSANMGVVFNGPGIPAGLSAGAAYYVLASGLRTNSFEFSATVGGAPVAAPGPSRGIVTAEPRYPGSFGRVLSHSNWGNQWWTGDLIRYDTIVAGGIAHRDNGGTVAADAPGYWNKISGFWVNGLDLSTATFSGTPINLGSSQNLAWNQDTCLGRGSAADHIYFGNCSAGDRSGGLYLGYVNVAGGGDFSGTLAAQRVVSTNSMRVVATTVSNLAALVPTPEVGERAFVTDATACAFATAVTGGGAIRCPVYFDGVWKAG